MTMIHEWRQKLHGKWHLIKSYNTAVCGKYLDPLESRIHKERGTNIFAQHEDTCKTCVLLQPK